MEPAVFTQKQDYLVFVQSVSVQGFLQKPDPCKKVMKDAVHVRKYRDSNSVYS